MKPVIEAVNLHKHYGKGSVIEAVDELGFELYESGEFGLPGSDGADKTTTTESFSTGLLS